MRRLFVLPILFLLALLAACAGRAPVRPDLVGKQAPPLAVQTGYPEKEAVMVTATLPGDPPASTVPVATAPASAGPTTPTPPPTSPAIAAEKSPELSSTVLQAPEFIEHLLWPGENLLLALSTGSNAYHARIDSPPGFTGQPVQWQMPENGGPIAFTPDGARVAVLNGAGMVSVFAPQPDGRLDPIGDVLMQANNASFSADGALLLLTDPAKPALTLFNVENGAPLKTLTGFAEGDRIYTALLSPDGKTAAWRSRGALQFQDVESESLSPLIKPEGMISEARFAPDGRSLAVIAGEHLEVYSAADGKQITRQQLSQPAPSLAFSPDGRLLAAAYGNGIQVWDTTTWQPLPPLTGATSQVIKISFSPDGRTLVSADETGAMLLWTMP